MLRMKINNYDALKDKIKSLKMSFIVNLINDLPISCKLSNASRDKHRPCYMDLDKSE